MRFPIAAVAGLLCAGVLATPVQAQAAQPEGAYWRVEKIRTFTHPKPVGTGYWLTERTASVSWRTVQGKEWFAFRPLGAKPKTEKDEAAWRADGSPTSWTYRTEGMKVTLSMEPGKGHVGPAKGREAFHWGEKFLTFQDLQALPTDPAALRERIVTDVKAWAAEAAEEAKTTAPNSKLDDWLSHLDQYVAQSAGSLLYEHPVPRQVRAAAFQVLKTTKGVGDLGRAKDPLGRSGQKLALPTSDRKGSVLKQQVLVDTTTMTLLAQYVDLKDDGKPVHGKEGVTTIKAGWTDEKPAIPAGG